MYHMREQSLDQPDTAKARANGPDSRRRWPVLIIICLVVAGIGVVWNRIVTAQSKASKEKTDSRQQKIPVAVVDARKDAMAIYLNGLGTVTPLNTVNVKTRVDGQLMEVLFHEGQMVKAGELIARIDSRPFEVQLTQAEGQLARDEALLKNARIDLERYKVLWQQDSIPKQQLDTQEAQVHQYEGAVKVDQGQIDSARLQITYCRIVAPIDGRIGLRLVDPGNMVHAADTNGVAVITQLQPIAVLFPLPEDSLPRILARLNKKEQMPVEAYDRAQKTRLAVGSLLTVDNQVDTSTGTIRFKAVFSNKASELFPNQFVNTRLLVDTKRDTIVIPAAALQKGPQGSFVYVVRPDGTAAVRPVRVSDIQGGEAAIDSGLSSGEPVVVDGAERLREGAPVETRRNGDKATGRGH